MLSWALGYLLIDWALIPALLTARLRDGHAAISARLQQDNMSTLHSGDAANLKGRITGETKRDTIWFFKSGMLSSKDPGRSCMTLGQEAKFHLPPLARMLPAKIISTSTGE